MLFIEHGRVVYFCNNYCIEADKFQKLRLIFEQKYQKNCPSA